MKRKAVWIILSFVMVVALVLASCGPAAKEGEKEVVKGKVTKETVVVKEEEVKEEEVKEEEEKEEVVTKITGPQYGGTISYGESLDPTNFDPWWHSTRDNEQQSMYLETLGSLDWTVDREVLPLNTGARPFEFAVGNLAESWETPDKETIIFHIRKGVRWQNKPPVNGREMTADDVAYSFNRLLGLGGYGFTEPSPFSVDITITAVTSVEATDKYTVVVKHEPSVTALWGLLISSIESYVIAREVVEQYGDLRDWRNAVGTGPWMLVDYVEGASLSYIKNPDYWGYDEKYPENRLPYADGLKDLIIPDLGTRLAALRSGKIDVIGMEYGGTISWEQTDSLKRTNPYLLSTNVLAQSLAILPRYGEPPFDDIRVRKAMQMAIDVPTIAMTYYGGYSEPTLRPPLGNPGTYAPFDELPEDIKEGRSYNPEKAKELLAEAGYPDGFKTSIICTEGSWSDLDLLQIAKAYLADIGIDMELKVHEWTAFYGRMMSGEWEEDMTWWLHGGMILDPPLGIFSWTDPAKWWNASRIDDPHFNELYAKLQAVTDIAEHDRLVREINDYSFSQFWGIMMPRQVGCVVWNPWLGGYSGETYLGLYQVGPVFARMWVEQDLKKSILGR